MLIISAGALLIAVAVWFLVPSAGAVRVQALGDREPARPWDVRAWLAARGPSSRRLTPERRLVHALRALAAELGAGSAPGVALERAAGEPPLWPRALAAARFGDAIEQGLLDDARESPALRAQLQQLSACWSVGTAHGAGLVTSIERLALSVQAQFELRSLLGSELAAPRATMRMLGLLPVVGIAMGYLLGADPIGWFLHSTAGAVIVVLAVILSALGVLWTRRIVQRVERAMSRG